MQGLRAAATVGVVALVLLTGGTAAHAGGRPAPDVSIVVDNRAPTPSDEITVTIHYTLADGCYDLDEGQPEQPDQTSIVVSIHATEVPGPCAGPTDRTLHRIIGPLPAENYTIGAQVDVDYLCQNQKCAGASVGISTTVPVAAVGDANCDRSINSIDANIVLQQSAELSTAPCPQGADANRDGDVQSIDATLILQYGAGLLAQLPPA